jgi:hypothetical protein
MVIPSTDVLGYIFPHLQGFFAGNAARRIELANERQELGRQPLELLRGGVEFVRPP